VDSWEEGINITGKSNWGVEQGAARRISTKNETGRWERGGGERERTGGILQT